MSILRLITVLEVSLRETRVRDIIASEALLMRVRHNQIARGSRLFTYLTIVKYSILCLIETLAGR